MQNNVGSEFFHRELTTRHSRVKYVRIDILRTIEFQIARQHLFQLTENQSLGLNCDLKCWYHVAEVKQIQRLHHH